VIFSVLTDRMRVSLANQRSRPEFAFDEALASALWQDHPRAQPMTLERVDQMDLDKSLAFYEERLADAGDFVFVFVGSFDSDTLRPLVERYLASLPSTGRNETWRDVGVRPAFGVVNRRVEKGIDPQSQTHIVFTGGFRYDVEHRVMIRAMTMALEGTLRNVLREDLGGTYGVSVSATASKVPVPQYRVSIAFGSDPEQTETLVRAVFEKIEELKQFGPSREDVNNITRIFERELETNSRQNGYLLREITRAYQNDEDLRDVFNLPDIYARVNAPAIQRAAELYLDTGSYVKVELFPEQ
jgi:zinc protease